MQYSVHRATPVLRETPVCPEERRLRAPSRLAGVAARHLRFSRGPSAQQVAAMVSTARDEECARIGRELHDALGAQLTALEFTVAQLRLQSAAESMTELCDTLETLVADAQQAAAHIVHALHPPLLDTGLSAALRGLARQFGRHHQLPCEWHCDDDASAAADQLPSHAAHMLYRIAQEALNNVAKHAHARRVTVSLAVTARRIELVICDDGIGFTANPQPVRRTFGIQGMRERCLSLGGTFHVDSILQQGTTLRASLPRQLCP